MKRKLNPLERHRIRVQSAAQSPEARSVVISLPTNNFYGGKPVTYWNGRLMVAGQVIRTRQGMSIFDR